MSKLNLEKEFFTYLQRQFSKNDFVQLNQSFTPENCSNKLNRFYNDEYSIWFARLKKTDKEKYYYFGLKYDESQKSKEISPRLILRFNDDSKFSCVRIIKNQYAVMIKVDNESEVFSKLYEKFSLMTSPKYKSKGIYFILLGKTDSKKLINNIMKLVVNFSFELKMNTNFLRIVDVLDNSIEAQLLFKEDIPVKKYHPITFDTLKFNFKAIEFKNNLKSINLNDDFEKGINDYVFSTDDNDDFLFNEDFKKGFSKSQYDMFDLLNRVVLKLSSDSSFEDFLKIINVSKEEG